MIRYRGTASGYTSTVYCTLYTNIQLKMAFYQWMFFFLPFIWSRFHLIFDGEGLNFYSINSFYRWDLFVVLDKIFVKPITLFLPLLNYVFWFNFFSFSSFKSVPFLCASALIQVQPAFWNIQMWKWFTVIFCSSYIHSHLHEEGHLTVCWAGFVYFWGDFQWVLDSRNRLILKMK